MAPIMNGESEIGAIQIPNDKNRNIVNEEVVDLEGLPEDMKELCYASLKVFSNIYSMNILWINNRYFSYTILHL